MSYKRTRLLILFIISICLLVSFGITLEAKCKTENGLKVETKFLENISGSNKFIFNINIEENNTDGTIKEFFVEQDGKTVPLNTYKISEEKYIVIINFNNNSYNIKNLKLGANIIVNRSQQSIKNIATLNAENKKFRAGKVLGDPMLLYHNQDKIVLAVEIDDPWDMLKTVQATLVYPMFRKDFVTSFEKKYVVVSEQLKQYVYITLEGFKSGEALKFNINLLFQKALNDTALQGINKVFEYNFDKSKLTEKFVNDVYSEFLGRNATDSEMSKTKYLLINRNLSTTKFIISIVESNDFKSVKMSDEDFINKIYKVTLNRESDENGQKFWVGEIKKSSRLDVLKKMLTNEEYVRLMSEIGLVA